MRGVVAFLLFLAGVCLLALGIGWVLSSVLGWAAS